MYSGSAEKFGDEYIRYVLDTYSAMLIRLCYSYVKNMHDAEDIAQDVFCELIKRRPDFDGESHEKAWLMKTAANKCKNHLRSGWVNKTVSLEDSTEDISDSSGGADESARLVLEAVNGLPEKYRTVIHMFYYCGLSIAEIASVKSISAATVGTQLARGRELLRKKLGDDF